MQKEHRNRPSFKNEVGFGLIHLAPLFAFWTGFTLFDWIVCFSLYVIRMFFITGGYHRYFAHRSYKTSRAFQFFLAFMAQTSVQKGALWWAAHHREHHRHSDQPEDPHSMKIYGFLYSHLGWILGPDYKQTKYGLIKDFTKYKELVFLNKYHLIPPIALVATVYILGCIVNGGGIEAIGTTAGVSTLWIGFFLSTVFLYHGTFCINSLTHYFGNQRYKTGDESRNNFWLALITLGEGWHNNHHYYPMTTKAGFFWWEIDITYYVLKLFSYLGLVWDFRGVPKHIKYSENLEDAQKKKREMVA